MQSWRTSCTSAPRCGGLLGVLFVCLLQEHWPLVADSKLAVPGAALQWVGRLCWQVFKPLLRPAGRGTAVRLLASSPGAPKHCLPALSSPAMLEPPSAASLPCAPQCHATLPTSRLLELHVSEAHDSFFAAQAARRLPVRCCQALVACRPAVVGQRLLLCGAGCLPPVGGCCWLGSWVGRVAPCQLFPPPRCESVCCV